MMKILSIIILITSIGCQSRSSWTSNKATKIVSVLEISKEQITIDQVNSIEDIDHRHRAKELGIMYVDYLHLLNNDKLRVHQSSASLYHNYPR
jgi:hypothetical protein